MLRSASTANRNNILSENCDQQALILSQPDIKWLIGFSRLQIQKHMLHVSLATLTASNKMVIVCDDLEPK